MREPHTYPSTKARLVHAAANSVCEGPVWHATRQSFFWVDFERKMLQEIAWLSKEVQCWPMSQRIGMVALCGDADLVVALQDGLAIFDLETTQLEWFVYIEKDVKDNRPNDGKCDSSGRLWLGTMDVSAKDGAGSLYCVTQNRRVTPQLISLTIANGMVWSGDDRYFYFIDSPLKQIDRYLFDAHRGMITFDRTVVTTPGQLGLPDGMTIDEEGMLWVAQCDGFCVCRWNPENGALLHKIEVPVPQVRSCTFGGENLDQLFISTARVGLSEQASENYPDSGGVFIARPGVKGLLSNEFNYSKPN